jgi:hypothetical protein
MCIAFIYCSLAADMTNVLAAPAERALWTVVVESLANLKGENTQKAR